MNDNIHPQAVYPMGAPMTAEEMMEAKAELWALLARQVQSYTTGESTSVPTELAEELLESLCYTLGIRAGKTDGMQRLLQGDSVKLYEEGVRALERKMVQVQRLWEVACLGVPKVDNRSLTDTLREVKDCWKRYDVLFFAHICPVEVDYQLCHPVAETVQGIDYIIAYLRRLIMENHFLHKFSEERVVSLLDSHSPNYQELLINLYEPVAVNALGLELVGGDPLLLDISPQQRAGIVELLRPMSKEERGGCLQSAAKQLCQRLEIENAEAQQYLGELAKNLQLRLEAVLHNGELEGIFLSFLKEGRSTAWFG